MIDVKKKTSFETATTFGLKGRVTGIGQMIGQDTQCGSRGVQMVELMLPIELELKPSSSM
jgi:hypothetical protein